MPITSTIILVACLSIITLAIIYYTTQTKETISPDPFRAAMIEMSAAQNDPISRYLYSNEPYSYSSCMQQCDNRVDSSFGLTDTYGDERKQLCYVQCQEQN